MATVGVILLLFVNATFGTGLLASRVFARDPLERLCLAVAGGLIFLYGASFVVYVVNAPLWAYKLISVISFIALLLNRHVLRDMFDESAVCVALGCYTMLVCWGLLCATMISSYSGGYWALDWFEHFQRAMFFLNHWPLEAKFLGTYALSARPPAFNLITAYFLSHCEATYAVFQIVTVVVGAACLFPALLFARTRKQYWLVAFLFALNPMFIQNLTYTWPRLATTLFVVLGIYFYATALPDSTFRRQAVAYVLLGMGVAVHYSAAPFLIIVGAHHFVTALLGRLIIVRYLLAYGVCGALCMIPWIGFSIWRFGFQLTFGSNSTVLGIKQLSWLENATKIRLNLRDSILPDIVHYPLYSPLENSPTVNLVVREIMFILFQRSILMMFGCLNVLFIILLFYRLRISFSNRGFFWPILIGGGTFLGIAVIGARDPFGLAHICLVPIMVLGVSFLAIQIDKLSTLERIVFVGGVLVDAVAGIGLHFWFQIVPLQTINLICKNYFHLVFLGETVGQLSYLFYGAIVVIIGVLVMVVFSKKCAGSAPFCSQ